MIGEKVRKARREIGISQQQLAGELVMTRSYISMVENGHTIPSEQTLEKLAFHLQKPVHYFQGEAREDHEVVGAAYLRQAEQLIGQGNAEDGFVWLDRLEQLKMDDYLWVKALLMRIDFWISKKQYDQAYQCYMERKQYLEKVGDRLLRYDVQMKVAKLYFRMERFNDSIAHYQQAIQLVKGLKSYHRSIAETYTFLGTCYIRVGSVEDALSAYLSAFECAKLEGDEKQLGDISMGIGKAYLHQKNYVKAKSWTETCVGYYQQQSQKDQMAALFNLAAIERKLGNLDSFRDMLACCTWYARKRDPELFSKCLVEIAICHFIQGEFYHTRQYCERALESLAGRDSTYLRGEIYRLLGAGYLVEERDEKLAYFFSQASADLFRRIPLPAEAAFSNQLLQKSKAEIIAFM
ncbi:tetratricopeptide repeat protein [Rossellomorea aquimaris]|nr:tetratricopeptide repeat protein [Rossellomorea aquimaris]